MKPENKPAEPTLPAPMAIDHDLASLLNRLEALSLAPEFRAQREVAMARALRPYVEYAQQIPITMLAEEILLANLYVYADFFPEDGQLDLIEQLRDMIEVHVPAEERVWLDPVHHSYMDLLEIRSVSKDDPEGAMVLRSLGDGRQSYVVAGHLSRDVKPGEVLLARLVRRGERVVLAGPAIVLSATNARAILEAAHDWRRHMEMTSGSFALGEWQEFAKRYGYVLLWQVAEARLGRLLKEESAVRFVSATGGRFLYALALYEHHEHGFLAEGMTDIPGLAAEDTLGATSGKPGLRRWVEQEHGETVGRVTLTQSQLIVECDSAQRLDHMKHRLAAAFGFALHFRGETTAKPSHDWAWSEVDLREEAAPARTVVVSVEEEHALLTAFLEAVYLEWANQPAPSLNGQIPRNVGASADRRADVRKLIDDMASHDVGIQRTGKPAFDYNKLLAHVGLD
jgi:hypothetical protein